MEEKQSFLKNKIDLESPNKNIVPVTTSIGGDGKLTVGGCSIEELVKKYCHDADIVHHLAGITAVPRVKSQVNDQKEKEIEEVGVVGTQNILDVISDNCKIIMPSSHVVYESLGEVKKDINEDELTKDINMKEHFEIIGSDEHMNNSVMCLDNYKLMDGYRYYENNNKGGITFETPRNIEKLSFKLLSPDGNNINISNKDINGSWK